MSKHRIPESLTLRKARMISYSQMYAGERPSVESFVSGIPTDEAVEWCSYIVFRKDNLKIHAEELIFKAVCPNTLVIQSVKDTLVATLILSLLQLLVDSVKGGVNVIAIL